VNLPRAVNDDTLVRIDTLTARLTERIEESRDVRARLTEALAANAWPDVRSVSWHAPLDDRRRER
jgi:hypothetical protein